jgi:hypothetical protein
MHCEFKLMASGFDTPVFPDSPTDNMLKQSLLKPFWALEDPRVKRKSEHLRRFRIEYA